MTKRILYLAPYSLPLSIGGFQSQVYHIYSALKECGAEVDWYRIDELDPSLYDVLQVIFPDPSMYLAIKRLKNMGLKIVMTPMLVGRQQSVFQSRICLSLSRLPHFFSIYKQRKLLYGLADAFTPLCEFEKSILTDVYGVRNDCIHLIPNGIDDVFFTPNIQEVGLPFNDYVLTVGRIEDNKNQLLLIKTIISMGLKLIIVGEPGANAFDYYNLCKSISTDNVVFWGIEKNPLILKYLYQQARVVVIPSKKEIAPLVAFESLSMKTPVVCTKHCGIANQKINGLIFSEVDEDSIKRSINLALSINRNSINNDGIFSWNDVAQLYIDVYQKLL